MAKLKIKITIKSVLRVGTDCSGVEAPLMALDQLGIKYQHIFSSEINPDLRKYILKNHPPQIMYSNMTTRDHTQVPHVDLYVAGFPCQSFTSLKYNAKGLDDPKIGNLLFHCIETIRYTQPKVFILENVRGILTHDKGHTMARVTEMLDSLSDYLIKYKVLNTKDYGIPQSRNRVYWVGFNKKVPNAELFEYPTPVSMPPIENFIDASIDPVQLNLPIFLQKRLDLFVEWRKSQNKPIDLSRHYIITLYNGTPSWMRTSLDYCPCLTRGPFNYCTWLGRNLTLPELTRLQGFPKEFPIHEIEKPHMAIGNSMSVNVLVSIMKNIFKIL